jgi:PLP dependent protein
MTAPHGTSPTGVETLRRRHEELAGRIAFACAESGRDPRSVRVLPATKGREVEYLDALVALGYGVFAESRIGEFARKQKARPDLSWEYIGRFRPEDAPLLARSARLIHSVVGQDQAEALDRACTVLPRPGAVLLQVNLVGDPRKQGLRAEEAESLARGWPYAGLTLRGLMVLGPAAADARSIAEMFQTGHALFEQIGRTREKAWDTLSMGMSGDFESAVRAGATVVRIGTYLAEAWTGTGAR